MGSILSWESGMNTTWKVIILPMLLGAWLGVTNPVAHADCACDTRVRLLTPEQVPGEICLDDYLDCVDGFLAEGAIHVFAEDISLRVYIADDSYPLEFVQ